MALKTWLTNFSICNDPQSIYEQIKVLGVYVIPPEIRNNDDFAKNLHLVAIFRTNNGYSIIYFKNPYEYVIIDEQAFFIACWTRTLILAKRETSSQKNQGVFFFFCDWMIWLNSLLKGFTITCDNLAITCCIKLIGTVRKYKIFLAVKIMKKHEKETNISW